MKNIPVSFKTDQKIDWISMSRFLDLFQVEQNINGYKINFSKYFAILICEITLPESELTTHTLHNKNWIHDPIRKLFILHRHGVFAKKIALSLQKNDYTLLVVALVRFLESLSFDTRSLVCNFKPANNVQLISRYKNFEVYSKENFRLHYIIDKAGKVQLISEFVSFEQFKIMYEYTSGKLLSNSDQNYLLKIKIPISSVKGIVLSR